MTDILTLNCWILGDEIRRIFFVKVASSDTVGILKDEIKEKKHRFHRIDADTLYLWKVSSVGLISDASMLMILYFSRSGSRSTLIYSR